MIPIPKTMVKIVNDFLQLSQGSELYVFERGDPDRIVDPETETEIQLYDDEGNPVTQPVVSNGSGKFRYYVESGGKYDLWSPDDTVSPLEPWEAVDSDFVGEDAQEKVDTHNADTTSVHGIDNTADLATQVDAQTYANDAAELAIETVEDYVDAPATTNVQTGTTYTPITGDELNVIVEFTNNSLVTITLPNNVFVENAEIEFCALGTAGATFVAGVGVTLKSPGSLVSLPQNCSAVARYKGSGVWILGGALA